jgi:predicted dehydrogenase
VFPSSDALLNSGKVDALFICTPPFARGELEEKAAAKGIHLFAEKPVGLDLEVARRNARVIEQAGIINSSGYCLRYLESVQRAKAYLADKQINMVLTYRLGGLPGVKWWRELDKSGGQNTEQSTHQVDTVRYIAGDFAQVQALYKQRHIQTVYPDATISDVGIVTFTMESGAIGSLVNSCVSPQFGKGDIDFIGADFYVSIRGTSLVINDANQKLNEKYDTQMTLDQDRAFIQAILTGNQQLVLCSYAEAVKTLQATLAFQESADAGIPIAIG